MKASEEDDFYCPICGCNLLWMPVSRIFVCEHCKESFSESAECYLRKKKDVTKGNQQKMRETLLVVRDALDTISAHEDDIEFVRAWIRQTKEAVQSALAAPPSNCDVGTPEERKGEGDGSK